MCIFCNLQIENKNLVADGTYIERPVRVLWGNSPCTVATVRMPRTWTAFQGRIILESSFVRKKVLPQSSISIFSISIPRTDWHGTQRKFVGTLATR